MEALSPRMAQVWAVIVKYKAEIEAAATLKLAVNLKAEAGKVDCKAVIEHYEKQGR